MLLFRVSSSSRVSQFSRLIAYYKRVINVSTNRRRRESSALSLSHVNLLIICHVSVAKTQCWFSGFCDSALAIIEIEKSFYFIHNYLHISAKLGLVFRILGDLYSSLESPISCVLINNKFLNLFKAASNSPRSPRKFPNLAVHSCIQIMLISYTVRRSADNKFLFISFCFVSFAFLLRFLFDLHSALLYNLIKAY